MKNKRTGEQGISSDELFIGAICRSFIILYRCSY